MSAIIGGSRFLQTDEVNGMESGQYRELLADIHTDIADVEQKLSELRTLEKYVLEKLDEGGENSSQGSSSKAGRSTPKELASRSKQARDDMKQTIQFDRDGTPLTK